MRDGRATLPDGTLAGGLGTLADAVRRLVSLGVPLTEALDAASGAPARLLGREDIGTLRPGARADVVVLDDELAVREVLVAGQPVAQLGVDPPEVLGRDVGVEAARVRQRPERPAGDRLRLQAGGGLRPGERDAERAECRGSRRSRAATPRSAASPATPARISSSVRSDAARVGRSTRFVTPTP